MARLFDNATGAFIGEISEEDLDFLIGSLEEESADDVVYYINRDTVTLLRSEGATETLLAVLEAAVGESGEADIRWEES